MGVTERVLAQPGAAGDELHTGLDQLGLDVGRLGQRQLLDPLVDDLGVDGDRRQTGRADAELLVVAIARHHV